jgi:hypothetical protein
MQIAKNIGIIKYMRMISGLDVNVALLVVEDLSRLNTTQVVLASRQRRVVIEEIPSALKLDNGVVGSPANHRLQDGTTLSERTVWAVANGICQKM